MFYRKFDSRSCTFRFFSELRGFKKDFHPSPAPTWAKQIKIAAQERNLNEAKDIIASEDLWLSLDSWDHIQIMKGVSTFRGLNSHPFWERSAKKWIEKEKNGPNPVLSAIQNSKPLVIMYLLLCYVKISSSLSAMPLQSRKSHWMYKSPLWDEILLHLKLSGSSYSPLHLSSVANSLSLLSPYLPEGKVEKMFEALVKTLISSGNLELNLKEGRGEERRGEGRRGEERRGEERKGMDNGLDQHFTLSEWSVFWRAVSKTVPSRQYFLLFSNFIKKVPSCELTKVKAVDAVFFLLSLSNFFSHRFFSKSFDWGEDKEEREEREESRGEREDGRVRNERGEGGKRGIGQDEIRDVINEVLQPFAVSCVKQTIARVEEWTAHTATVSLAEIVRLSGFFSPVILYDVTAGPERETIFDVFESFCSRDANVRKFNIWNFADVFDAYATTRRLPKSEVLIQNMLRAIREQLGSQETKSLTKNVEFNSFVARIYTALAKLDYVSSHCSQNAISQHQILFLHRHIIRSLRQSIANVLSHSSESSIPPETLANLMFSLSLPSSPPCERDRLPEDIVRSLQFLLRDQVHCSQRKKKENLMAVQIANTSFFLHHLFSVKNLLSLLSFSQLKNLKLAHQNFDQLTVSKTRFRYSILQKEVADALFSLSFSQNKASPNTLFSSFEEEHSVASYSIDFLLRP